MTCHRENLQERCKLLDFKKGGSKNPSKGTFGGGSRVGIFEGIRRGILNYRISFELKVDSWKSDLSQGKPSEKV